MFLTQWNTSTKQGGEKRKSAVPRNTSGETLMTTHSLETAYLDTLYLLAGVELRSEKAVYLFWNRHQPRKVAPVTAIVRRLAEEVRKIAYREEWYSAGTEQATQAVAWRICQHWQEERGP